MTGGTLQRGVPGNICLQVLVGCFMAGAAGSVWYFLWILLYVRSTMGRVAEQAILELLIWQMWIMAVKAAGDISMFFCMASLAVHFSIMQAGILGEFLPLPVMADRAENDLFLTSFGHSLGKLVKINHPRSVGLFMALHAICEILAMNQLMAILTFRHDRVPVCLAGIVGMKLFMAVNTVEPVFAARLPQPVKLVVVAPAAFRRCQRFDILCIDAGRLGCFLLALLGDSR